jgi:hypothetical protein
VSEEIHRKGPGTTSKESRHTLGTSNLLPIMLIAYSSFIMELDALTINPSMELA